MRPLYELVHRLRDFALSALRMRTRGVKVMAFNEAGELLLIRNSYGATRLLLLPGGGIDRGETPEAAAVREVAEETGLEVRGLAPVAEYFSRAGGKRDTIHLFAGRAEGEPVPDAAEVEEAAFFSLDALPENVSPATLRRIAEYRGDRPRDPLW